MPTTPLAAAEGPVRVSVLSEGNAVPDEALIISVTIGKALNRVPWARLTLADGDITKGTFDLSDSATFAPGAEIVVKLGHGGEETEVFRGIVVKQGVSITGNNVSRLVVDCHDKAVKLTVGRKSALYKDMTDSSVISQIVSDAGLSAGTIDATTLLNRQLVQHYCSDWDFLLARAEANGMVVMVDGGSVGVARPAVTGSAALKVTFGESIIDFKAELDARQQYTEVKATAWSPKDQALLTGAASPASLNRQGNLDSSKLAGVLGLGTFELRSDTAMSAEALKGWAAAQQLKSGLARLRGHMKFQGSALAQAGPDHAGRRGQALRRQPLRQQPHPSGGGRKLDH